MAGIYIHIPFCMSRCIYCNFYSTIDLQHLHSQYVNAIDRELRMRCNYINKERVSTIYVGGGTPSTLHPNLLKQIASSINDAYHLQTADIKEFTIECNPDDITEYYAKEIVSIGINRVSLGVQSFSNDRLHFLGRRHNAQQVHDAVRLLRKFQIKNISIDLIFGFPNESIDEWAYDIDNAIKLDVEHISAYSLMYENGTVLHKMLKDGVITECDESVSKDMYDMLIDRLYKAGYEQYEISNFAKPNYNSLHNSGYWNDSKYLGIGAAAHSYNGNSRQRNVSNISKYIKDIEKGKIPAEIELIDPITHYNDTVTTALRTIDGIDLSTLQEPYKSYIIANAGKNIANGNLRIDNNRLILTRQGLYVSDDIMSDLIMV